MLKSWIKHGLFVVFDQQCLILEFFSKIFKNCYCHIWNQHPQISLFAKFCKKNQKCLNVGPNSLFRQIWGRNLQTILWYLKSAPSILFNYKILQRTKLPKVGTENACIGHFWVGVSKQYCHTWNQHSRICLIAKHGT